MKSNKKPSAKTVREFNAARSQYNRELMQLRAKYFTIFESILLSEEYNEQTTVSNR